MVWKTWWILAVALCVACNGCGEEVIEGDDVAIADASGPDAGDEEDVRDEPDGDTPRLAYFDLLREMRAELRDDPNYLRYERDRRVATGDPQQIYDFVRSLRTLPAGSLTWGTEMALLNGPRGTLRTGAGSMRDKVELFNEMMTEAGFEVRVQALSNPADVPTLRPPPDETIGIDPEKLQAWADWLAIEPDASLAPSVDPDGAQAMALADELIAALPEDLLTTYADRWEVDHAPDAVPIASFRGPDDDGWTLADVVSDDVPLGEVRAVGEPDLSRSIATREQSVVLKLVMRTASRGAEVVATLRTRAPDIVGRQVRFGFAPIGDPAENLLTPLTSFSTFTPFFTLHGIDVSEEEEAAFTAVGDPVTIHSEVVEVDEATAEISVGEYELPGEWDGDASAVVDVVGEVDATRFREVRLRLNPIDVGGSTVERLPAAAFEVVDDGAEVAPMLLQNTVEPQILFLLDESTSVPPQFRLDGVAPLVRNIAATILADAPEAQFGAMKVGQARLTNGWTNDLDELYDDVATEQTPSSGLWRALSHVRTTGATACVMITDGDPTDQPSAAIEAILSTSPPCVFLKAGGPDNDVLDQMAQLVGGEVYEIADHVEATSYILEFLDRIQPYLLRYRSVSDAPGEHLVNVTVGSTSLDLSYVVPDIPSDQTDIRTLELEIVSSGTPTVRRVLAGDTGRTMTNSEAWRAMLDVHTIAFEGEALRPHEVLDELLANRLGEEALAEAYYDGDPELARDAITQGARWMPYDALALLTPRGGLDPSFAVNQLRGVLVSKRSIDEHTHESTVDLLALGYGFHKFGAASEADLRATIAESLRSSFVAAKRFDVATVPQLDGKELVYLTGRSASQLRARFPTIADEQVARWERATWPWWSNHHLLVPVDGDPVAFYAVFEETGATYGVIDDGSSGARTRAQLDEAETIDSLLSLYRLSASFTGASPAFGFLVVREHLNEKYSAVEPAISTLASPPAASIDTWDNVLQRLLTSPANPTDGLKLGAGDQAVWNVFDAAGGWSLTD